MEYMQQEPEAGGDVCDKESNGYPVTLLTG